MSLGDVSKIDRRTLARMPDGCWTKDAIEGYKLMRKGKDYVDTDGRYDRALEKLVSAREKLVSARGETKMSTVEKIDLARLCLWIGIAKQENTTRDSTGGTDAVVKRNQDAVVEYERGLSLVRLVRDKRAIGLRMSLYNSMGVACEGSRHVGRVNICEPNTSMSFYRKAVAVYDACDDPDVRSSLQAIRTKVAENSGGRLAVVLDRVGGGVLKSNRFRSGMVGGGNFAF